jgi:hypothetical protein
MDAFAAFLPMIVTSLISRLQSIGGHDVAPYVVGQCQVYNALLALRHKSDSGQQALVWE